MDGEHATAKRPRRRSVKRGKPSGKRRPRRRSPNMSALKKAFHVNRERLRRSGWLEKHPPIARPAEYIRPAASKPDGAAIGVLRRNPRAEGAADAAAPER